MNNKLLALFLFLISSYCFGTNQNINPNARLYNSQEIVRLSDSSGDSCQQKGKASNKPCQTSKTEKALQQKTEEMRKAAEGKVGEFLKKRYCIDNNLISSYSKEVTQVYMARFGPKTKELGDITEALNNLVKAGPQNKDPEELKSYQKKLTSLIKDLNTGFNEICEADNTLCGCYGG